MKPREVTLVKECVESLRTIRALKGNELGPDVTGELDAIIQTLDEFSKANPGDVLPEGAAETVMKALAKVAIAIPWIKQILGWIKE